MKQVTWTDNRGYRHKSLIRDSDPDSMAPKGVLQDPPNVEALDWEDIKREIHNSLLDNGLITWQDVQRQGNGVSGVIQAVLRRRLVELYRLRGEGQ